MSSNCSFAPTGPGKRLFEGNRNQNGKGRMMNNQNQTGIIMNTNTSDFIDDMATELMETNESEWECNDLDYYVAEMSGIIIY